MQRLSPDFCIYLKTLTGRTHALNVHKDWSIDVVKSLIRIVTGNPEDEQRLIFAGRQLKDRHSLSDCNIRDGATLHLVLRLSGD